ncbi:kelch-like protein 8 isoform X1 [Antedon mediterranea]|uniref:kelch-like protein 8 isoform X1 n=1 Tax=Antedon mediterranea TaxID=105859 RepID=UPI003AF911D3
MLHGKEKNKVFKGFTRRFIHMGCVLLRPFDRKSTVIIEISGTTSRKSKNMEADSILPIVQRLQISPRLTTTFECHTHWKDSFSILQDLYLDRKLCDITLIVGNKHIHCHRLVLACCSPYFKAMLTSDMAESRQDVITIKDLDEDAVDMLINFMYTAKLVLTIENVQQLLYAASILQLEVITKACCDFMRTHLHPSNCLGVRNFAELHGRSELVKSADKFTHEFFCDIVRQEDFLNISFDHFLAVIDSSDLNIENEMQVYKAVMKWVKHDLPGRERCLPELMSKVRLPMMSPEFLMEEVENEELFRRNHECRDLVDEAKNYYLALNKVVSKFSPKSITSDRVKPRKSCAGVVFVVGGRGATGDPFRSMECYDYRNDTWLQVKEMNWKRRHVGVTSVNGKVYAVGGHDGREHLNSMEVFDPKRNTWVLVAPMNNKRRGLAVASLGGPLYAIGGLDDEVCFSEVERYDINTNTWEKAASMNTPRGGVGVCTFNGYIYAIGGNDGQATLNTCERYNPHLNKWTEIAPMHTRRAGGGLTVLNRSLFAIGGFDDSSPLNTVERYDVLNDKWKFVKPMNVCRGGVGVTTMCGKIFAVGGHNGSAYLNSVECYDPETDSWTMLHNIAICRAGAGVITCACNVQMLKDATKTSGDIERYL